MRLAYRFFPGTCQSPPISNAERSRCYRDRKRDKINLITIEVDEQVLKGLVWLGLVAGEDARNRDCVEDGILMLMQAVSEDGVEIRAEWIERTF